MKKSLLIALVIFALSTTSVIGQALIDTTTIETGILVVQNNSNNAKRVKVLVEKDQVRYQYDLNNKEESFPLQMGNGSYQISILENTEGNKYRVLSRETVKTNFTNEKSVFLGSIQMVNWNRAMKPIAKAQELVKGLETDEEKTKAIYEYIINNIDYDYDKASTVASGYLPSIDQTYQENRGICYDYASLFAAMLRSVNIPTKLVMGYAPNVKEYHAWNEVYLAERGEWVTIDTTVDAQYNKGNVKFSMIKDGSLFNTMKVY